MAKKSAKDELIARLDADIARVKGHAEYFGETMTESQHERVDVDITKYEGMRDYVSAAVPVAGDVPDTAKPKRTRKKKGLPAATNDSGE